MYEFLFRNHNNIEIILLTQKIQPNTIRDFIYNLKQLKYNDYDYLPTGEAFCNQHPEFIQTRCLTTAKEKYLAGSEYFYCNYCINKIDPTYCYKYFIIDRDINMEKDRYDNLCNKIGNKYIIINENKNLGQIIDRKKITKNLPIYNLNNSTNIVFDMIKIIENAEEIHLISTFWSLIIYYLQKKYNLFENIPIFFYSYVRHGRLDCLYKEYDSNWTFINCPNNCKHFDHIRSGFNII